MSQYEIIMYIISMQSEVYLLNLYLSCLSISYTKKLKATFEQLLDFGATFEQLLRVLEQLSSNFLRKLEQLVNSPNHIHPSHFQYIGVL